jgi:hypothetical protein
MVAMLTAGFQDTLIHQFFDQFSLNSTGVAQIR